MTVNKWVREKVWTIYERRRIPTVVVGVVSPSSPCARPLLCTRGRRSNDHHRRSKNQWGIVHHIQLKYQRGRIPIVVMGVASSSFTCARRFDVMHFRMKGGAAITDGRKYQRGRIPTIIVGVPSPSFPRARHFGVMHPGTKGGVTITDGWMYQRGSAHHIHHVRWEFSRKTRKTESQPVMNINDRI